MEWLPKQYAQTHHSQSNNHHYMHNILFSFGCVVQNTLLKQCPKHCCCCDGRRYIVVTEWPFRQHSITIFHFMLIYFVCRVSLAACLRGMCMCK